MTTVMLLPVNEKVTELADQVISCMGQVWVQGRGCRSAAPRCTRSRAGGWPVHANIRDTARQRNCAWEQAGLTCGSGMEPSAEGPGQKRPTHVPAGSPAAAAPPAAHASAARHSSSCAAGDLGPDIVLGRGEECGRWGHGGAARGGCDQTRLPSTSALGVAVLPNAAQAPPSVALNRRLRGCGSPPCPRCPCLLRAGP